MVGIDDGVCLRQFVAWQVVVGDEDLHAQAAGVRYACDAGDAVINGDEYIGTAFVYALCDGGGEAVAVGNAVGYKVVHMLCPQQAQAAYGYGGCGGTVAVVVGNDADAIVGGDGISQQAGGSGGACELVGGEQVCEVLLQLGWAVYAAGCVQAS